MLYESLAGGALVVVVVALFWDDLCKAYHRIKWGHRG